MIVTEKKPVPIYEVMCCECKSKIQYKKSEVFTCHIQCPVCGVSLWANTILPYFTYEPGELVLIHAKYKSASEI